MRGKSEDIWDRLQKITKKPNYNQEDTNDMEQISTYTNVKELVIRHTKESTTINGLRIGLKGIMNSFL